MDVSTSRDFCCDFWAEDIVMAHGGYGLEARAGAILEGLGVPTEVHREPLRVLSGMGVDA